MIIDLNEMGLSKETIEKASTICNAEDDDLSLSLMVNAFGGDTAYTELCLAIATIYYSYGFEDGVEATAVKLLSNKE